VIGHPEVRPHTYDLEGEIPVPMHESIYHLIAKEDFGFDPGMIEARVVGSVTFVPLNAITWNPHIGVLPEYRGRGTEVLRAAMEWVFVNTPCRKLVAHPPTSNPRMIRVFEKCGFVREGYSPASFPWRGQVYDRVLMGASCPS
jgi:RimJ/RimL family protein N-acetyltransferase